jgi:O-antigen/teichoic acid export membrane protein
VSSLLRKSVILSAARLTNYAIVVVGPLFLVRLLDVQTYGEYREFLLYAMLLASLLGLSIKENLLYFIPRYPARADVITTQTIGMLLLTTTVGLGVFALGANRFMVHASFSFLVPLMVYVFLFVNLDVLENYWIGCQRPVQVLLFSSGRTLVRMVTVVWAAYALRDIGAIVAAIAAVEAAKFAVSAFLLFKLGLITTRVVDGAIWREQMRFIVPLSAASLLLFLNEKVGHLFIMTTLGAATLAIYTIGTYQLPIIAVVRSAVADTLFPEMVESAARDSLEGLDLWRTATLYYCFLVFPTVCVLFIFAEEFIRTLFTASYAQAVGPFRVSLLIMLRQCFEMGTPLRAANANKHMLLGNVFAIIVNLSLLYFLAERIGMIGVAVAWFASDLVSAGYLATRIAAEYRVSLGGLFRWRRIGIVAACAVGPLPLLLVGKAVYGLGIPVAVAVAVVYLVAFVQLVRKARIREIDRLLERIQGVLARGVGVGG